MNQAPNNSEPGTGSTFSSQASQASNPFTADLKGEFTSNFGTNANTNAVSQIFKDGGFVSQNRTKWIFVGVAVLAVLVIAFFLMTGDESTDDFASDETPAEETPAEATTAETAPAAEAQPAAPAEAAPAAATQAPAAGGTVALVGPADGSSRDYDETAGPAEFSWEGGGGYIVFSRSRTMSPETMRVPVSGNSYKFHNPWPGDWFWRVDSAAGGSSEVRRFTVGAPQRIGLTVSAPAAGAALAGTGGQVSWSSTSNRVAFYRVELSNGSWANPQYRFATSGNPSGTSSLSLQNVTPGSYQMRVGAFSEISGRWEYTAPMPVTVQ